MSVHPVPPQFTDDEPFPAPPRQARSRAARAKFLDAAMGLFAEQGYQATSIAQIAQRGGAAAGAFYIYFRSKRQLLIVLMNEFLARLAALDLRPKAAADVHAGLRQLLAAAFRADRQYYGVVRAWQEAALADPGLGRMQATIEAWTNARILAVFQALQRYPNARPGRDLAAFVRMMDRHFWSILARGAGLSARDFNREVRISADIIYHYLFHDPPLSDAKL